MNPNLTDITLVIDRSGSMQTIQSDAEGGVNAFIQEQSKHEGEALLTLVQFDTDYEFVHRGLPISQVPHYHLQPRGNTALLDAVGRAIMETGQRLAAMNEATRPGLVVFVVMTDGEENSSYEFTKDDIKQMTAHQQQTYNWQFIYLGANQDAFAEAGNMGFPRCSSADFADDKYAIACMSAGENVGRMRKQRSAGEKVVNEFTDEEREQMK